MRLVRILSWDGNNMDPKWIDTGHVLNDTTDASNVEENLVQSSYDRRLFIFRLGKDMVDKEFQVFAQTFH